MKKILLASQPLIKRAMFNARSMFFPVETASFIPYPPLKQAIVDPRTAEVYCFKDLLLEEELDFNEKNIPNLKVDFYTEQKFQRAWKFRCLDFFDYCGNRIDGNGIPPLMDLMSKYSLWKEFINRNIFIASPQAAQSYFDTVKELVRYTSNYLSPRQQQVIALALLYEFYHRCTCLVTPGFATRREFQRKLEEYGKWIASLSVEPLHPVYYEFSYANVQLAGGHGSRFALEPVGFKEAFIDTFSQYGLKRIRLCLEEEVNTIFTAANSPKISNYLTEAWEALKEAFPELPAEKFAKLEEMLPQAFKAHGLYFSQNRPLEEITAEVKKFLAVSADDSEQEATSKNHFAVQLVVTRAELASDLCEELKKQYYSAFNQINDPKQEQASLRIEIVAPQGKNLTQPQLFFNPAESVLLSLIPDEFFTIDRYIN